MFFVANNLWRGPRPKTFDEISDAGFSDIIDLESGTYDLLHDDKYEEQLALERTVINHRITCSYFSPPYSTQVEEFLKIVTDPNVKKVFVHCQAGKDRTGFMCAVYRMKVCGWSYEQAVKEYKDMGLHWYYYWWIPALKKYKN